MTTNGNGNSNGHSSLTQRKLETLLAHHDGIATALRTTLAVLRGDAVETKRRKGASVIQAALSLDSARRAQTTTKKRYDGSASRRKHAAKRRMAALLTHFDQKEARPLPPGHAGTGSGIGPLIHGGYLKKKAPGQYLRTAKEYQV